MIITVIHLYADVLYIEMAGCSPKVSGVQSTGGFMIADHTGSVENGGSCNDQLTSVKLQLRIILR